MDLRYETKRQELMTKYDHNYLNDEEVANELGISKHTVQWRIKHAQPLPRYRQDFKGAKRTWHIDEVAKFLTQGVDDV